MQDRKDYFLDHEHRVTQLEGIMQNINASLLRIETRLDRLEMRIDTINADLNKKIDRNFLWLLGIGFSAYGIVLGAMAHGFHWL